MEKEERTIDIKQLYSGLAVLTVGIILILQNLDLVHIGSIWRYWPLILIAVGVGKIIDPKSERGVGIVEVAAGLTFLAINFRFLGLNYRNAWPLVIVFVGLSIVVKSFTERNANSAKIGEHHDVR